MSEEMEFSNDVDVGWYVGIGIGASMILLAVFLVVTIPLSSFVDISGIVHYTAPTAYFIHMLLAVVLSVAGFLLIVLICRKAANKRSETNA